MNKGFTLLEILLSISILTVALFVATGYVSSDSTIIDSDHLNTINALNKAKTLSINSINDSSYGIKINDNSVILFKGNSFNTRDTSFDEVTYINSQLFPNTEIVFTKNYGFISNTVTLNMVKGSESKTIIINQKGFAY